MHIYALHRRLGAETAAIKVVPLLSFHFRLSIFDCLDASSSIDNVQVESDEVAFYCHQRLGTFIETDFVLICLEVYAAGIKLDVCFGIAEGTLVIEVERETVAGVDGYGVVGAINADIAKASGIIPVCRYVQMYALEAWIVNIFSLFVEAVDVGVGIIDYSFVLTEIEAQHVFLAVGIGQLA